MTSIASTATPFLLRFAAARSADPAMPGHYSPRLCVWVVDSEQGECPIIEVAGGSLVATQSKTMTQVEVDDDDPGGISAMDADVSGCSRRKLGGKPAVICLSELQTKTEAHQERDDEAVAPYW